MFEEALVSIETENIAYWLVAAALSSNDGPKQQPDVRTNRKIRRGIPMW